MFARWILGAAALLVISAEHAQAQVQATVPAPQAGVASDVAGKGPSQSPGGGQVFIPDSGTARPGQERTNHRVFVPNVSNTPQAK